MSDCFPPIADINNERHIVGMQLVSMRRLVSAGAAGVLPFLVTNLGIIAFHKGGFIHMTKFELAFMTAAGSVAMWLVLTAALSLLLFVSHGNRWFFALLSALLLYGLPPFIQPHFWSFEFWSEDAVNEPAVWLFVGGLVSTMITFYLARPQMVVADRRNHTAEQDR